MSIQRDEILRCARSLYRREGFGGMSMRKLAKCVGCTAPALYRHYESKEAVMRDVVGDAYRLFVQYLHRALEGTSPEERFAMGGKAYMDFALEQPALYEALYVPSDLLGIQPEVGSEAATHACAVGQFWTDRVREMMDTGFLVKGDPRSVSLTLWAHGHGLVSLYHRGLLQGISEEEFRALLLRSYGQLLRGIATKKYLDQLARDPSEDAREIRATPPAQDEIRPATEMYEKSPSAPVTREEVGS